MTEARKQLVTHILLGLAAVLAIAIGVASGLAIAATKNIQSIEDIGRDQPALPSQILDRNGQLITEFFQEEKREIVSIEEIPRYMVYALITREDNEFFEHNGFSLKGTIRAVWNIVAGNYFSGASTITQQVAGTLYADRSDISIRRKIVELWWAFQLERSLTKYEILQLYLNRMYFGSGTYGVEAASKFYFGHSVRDITLAESAMLVIQLASPGRNSPINNPNRAKMLQQQMLDQMVKLGYTTGENAERSFIEYWNNYDYTRSSAEIAINTKEDRAPFFSEYVRRQLEEMVLGSNDIYRDGFIVHTTLDLEYQQVADKVMQKGITDVNRTYQSNSQFRLDFADETFVPMIDLLSLTFNLDDIRVAGAKKKENARQSFRDTLNPVIDLVSLMFNVEDLKLAANMSYAQTKNAASQTQVEGALVTIENETGHILAMVGGSKFESINQFNRAVQARVMPGSAFKPLYYSAAIDSRKFTPATQIYDSPVVFWNDDGTPYTPLNYKGEWAGSVLLRTALAHSMNVPSIKVLDRIGFDAAINRASALLGMTSPEEIATFPRKYPLGLGVISVSPIRMAKAYATFANLGREVTPIGIRYIEDRNGRIIMEPEKELRIQQKKLGKDIQVISPQTAYIMTDLLQTTVQEGTLNYARNTVGDFDMPMAGKTGTTQNWSDAWTIGFSPYMTTAVWFGFDKPGQSLGVNQTGAVTGGPVWAAFMKEVHKGLQPKDFPVVTEGIRRVEVCAVSGQLVTPACDDGTVEEVFLAGTEPKQFCDFHEYRDQQHGEILTRLNNALNPIIPDNQFDDEPLSIGGLDSSPLSADPRDSDASRTPRDDPFGDAYTDPYPDTNYLLNPQIELDPESGGREEQGPGLNELDNPLLD